MVCITISGQPGSGTSTLVGKLQQNFNWSSLNGGQVFRDEASKRGMDLLAFGQLCRDDLSVDRALDEELQRRISEPDGPDVIESRLAGRWAYQLGVDCVRLWLDVSENERARRVVEREGGTLQQRLSDSAMRMAIDHARFEELYGFQPADPEPYSDTISADDMSADEVFIETLTILQKRGITNV
jgi:cytidylate kinase